MQQLVEKNTAYSQSSSSLEKSDSIYATTPFIFIVEGTAFYIHAGIVSRHSKPLERMITGGMSEAHQGSAVLGEVEKSTFARFTEWVYQGYYTAAAVKGRLPWDSELVKERKKSVSKPSPWALWDETHHQKHWSKNELKQMFIQSEPTVRREKIEIAVPSPRPNIMYGEDYTDVFLSHAKLYVFAEMYDVQKLRTLALENLQNALKNFILHDQRTGDIITLIRYVYSNTSARCEGDEMRMLLTHYVGVEMDTLMKDEGFKDLMIEDNGAMLGDFFKMVLKRIN